MPPTYVPILKGKPGEFKACRNADAAILTGTRVVMEVVPERGLDRDLTLFVRNVAAHWPKAEVLTVDSGFLDQTDSVAGTADGAVMWVASQFYDKGAKYRPVMHLEDDPDVFTEIAAAVELHDEGACLRLGSEEEYPDPDETDARFEDALAAADLDTDDVHLLIDLRSIEAQREIRGVTPIAIDMLAWAATKGPWASVTVASGAFPASISTFDKGAATPVPRYDAALYDAIVAEGPAIVPDFGDYAINHPLMPTSGFRMGPLPSLRYTADRNWQVFREGKDRPGNESFFTVCEKVVASPYWPAAAAAYSWGDAEVDRCSHSRPGAGTATEWRAYGTSHHIAVVIDRLATLGVP
jgi:hypothetical protein